MNYRISIALGTYNGEKYLAEQLNSFMIQTHLPDELIISDDCSTDASLSIAEAFRDQAPFDVKILINKSNIGYSQNFSKAMTNCTGDIVFLSDQDDVWLPSKIEKILSKFTTNLNLQLVIHDLDYCNANLIPIGQTKIERMSGVFDLDSQYIVGMATAIRTPFLKLCLPIPNEFGITHDSWLHDCARIVGGKAIIREVLALYRRHPSNLTSPGSLNVDFITTPDHFKETIKTTLETFKTKSILIGTEGSPLINWIKKNRNYLISEGYCEADRIDNFLDIENLKLDKVKERYKVLGLSRTKRLLSIVILYRNGGYKYFNGWKSALKDLLIN